MQKRENDELLQSEFVFQTNCNSLFKRSNYSLLNIICAQNNNLYIYYVQRTFTINSYYYNEQCIILCSACTDSVPNSSAEKDFLLSKGRMTFSSVTVFIEQYNSLISTSVELLNIDNTGFVKELNMFWEKPTWCVGQLSDFQWRWNNQPIDSTGFVKELNMFWEKPTWCIIRFGNFQSERRLDWMLFWCLNFFDIEARPYYVC